VVFLLPSFVARDNTLCTSLFHDLSGVWGEEQAIQNIEPAQ